MNDNLCTLEISRAVTPTGGGGHPLQVPGTAGALQGRLTIRLVT